MRKTIATYTIEDSAASIAEGLRRKLHTVEHALIVQKLEEIRRLARELPASTDALTAQARKLSDIAREVGAVLDSDPFHWHSRAYIPRPRRNDRLSSEQAQEIAQRLQAVIMNLEAYTGCYVPRDAGDVLRTERILHDRMGLPLPLVWQILETAEYWVRSVASCGDLTVAADNVAIRESLCCTASIPSGAKKYRPLRRMVFTIESRDQGWRTTTGDDSWTWFEADSKAAWRRAIVTNDPASADFCTHRIQWDTTASDDGFAVDAAELHEWMGRFARGDEISVFARAQYRARANHARKVVVELYCACV